jgi:hypothetical protein
MLALVPFGHAMKNIKKSKAQISQAASVARICFALLLASMQIIA